jgi:hypothetical protein
LTICKLLLRTLDASYDTKKCNAVTYTRIFFRKKNKKRSV